MTEFGALSCDYWRYLGFIRLSIYATTKLGSQLLLTNKKWQQLSFELLPFVITSNDKLLFSSAFLERLIEQIQDLPVGAAKFIRSPFLNCVHGIGIDTQHKAFIFCFFCQNQKEKWLMLNYKLEIGND